MSRATVDLQSVRFFLGFGLIFFFQHILTIVSVMVVLFVIEWRLALIALAITPLIVAVAYRYSHVSHPVLRDVQQKLGDVATVAEESIVGVHVVKSFAQEERRQASSSARRAPSSTQTVRAFRQRALYVPLLSFLPLARAGAPCCSPPAGWSSTARSTLGDFFVFNLLLAMLIVPLRSLGMWIGQAQRATASGERIFEVMDEPEGVDDRPGAVELPAGPGAIRFERRHASPTRRTGRCSQEIDLELAPGKTVALIGHTGSGKTTLAALVPRFYDATEGRVLVDGVDVRDVTRRSLRREIGVISQDPFLFSATVRENIAFGVLDATDEQVERGGARRAGARVHRGAAARLRHRDRRARDHALRRPAAAARDRPRARDRPAHPDPRRRDRLGRRDDRGADPRGLAEAMRGRTTIIIAHRLSTIALADEVVVLEHGRIAARGTQAEVLATSAVYREIHEHGLIQGLLKESGVKVWQPGGHLSEERGARGARLVVAADAAPARPARPAGAALPRPHARSRSPRCSSTRSSRSRRRTWRSSRSTRGSRTGDLGRLTWIVVALPRRRRSLALVLSSANTYLTGWVGERVLADLRNKLFAPPAAALARLLRAQPRRRDHQPDHERRRGARPARHRRRHEPDPEHAAPARHRGRPLLPRLAARTGDADGAGPDGARDRLVPQPLEPRLPPRARAARPRHGDARGGHRGHARRPVVHARAGAGAGASAASTTATAPRTTRRPS